MYVDNILDDENFEELNLSKEKDDFERQVILKNKRNLSNQCYLQTHTKTNRVFTIDNSLINYLFSYQKYKVKQTTRYSNWDMIYNELNILYPERLN